MRALTFEYQPADGPGVNTQVGATCVGDLTGSVAMATLTAGEGTNNAAWVVTPGAVLPGEFVTFTAADSKWPNDLPLTIDPDDAGDQELLIHTSCSPPLVLGDSFGSLVLTGISEDALGPSTRHSLYDLTIGAVGPEGPQGPQGKIGDTGDQGIQGKVGDTGDQGIQGKVGDTGDQGIQGKVGATGDQGIQGKVGATGDQGIQGKVGATGDQGIQGKVGATGDQGIQGKVGPQGATGDQGIQGKVGATGPQGIQGKVGPAGADGADGIGTNLLCFGTDQTIGSQGKFIGLGQQAGDHDTVGVISPFLARAEVVKLVVKVSQGNSPRDGDAQLFHDAVTAGGGPARRKLRTRFVSRGL